jgi:hypothetical protein
MQLEDLVLDDLVVELETAGAEQQSTPPPLRMKLPRRAAPSSRKDQRPWR